jgi:hypothetical protein
MQVRSTITNSFVGEAAFGDLIPAESMQPSNPSGETVIPCFLD